MLTSIEVMGYFEVKKDVIIFNISFGEYKLCTIFAHAKRSWYHSSVGRAKD